MGLRKNLNKLYFVLILLFILVIIIVGIGIYVALKYEKGYYRFIAYFIGFVLLLFFIPAIVSISKKIKCPNCDYNFKLHIPKYCPNCGKKQPIFNPSFNGDTSCH